jgi:hypothetical protein
MPVARIYASVVEESEPLCADLLARGYDVEVVFPGAKFSSAADLELRVERCSAAQAIARIEATGSPSHCVCVAPALGARREVLMVEMTVRSTGMIGRHPMIAPTTPFVADAATSISAKRAHVTQEDSALVPRLSFPALAQEPLSADALLQNGSALGKDGHISTRKETQLSRLENSGTKNEEIFDKNRIAELNAFLAHAARVEYRWQGLSLLAGTCSFLVLLCLGWFAATSHLRIARLSLETPASTKVAVPHLPTARTPAQQLRGRRGLGNDDVLVAQDGIVRIDGGPLDRPHPEPAAASLTKIGVIQPTTIKKITDLK